MKKVNLLSRAEMRKVMGGNLSAGHPCDGKPSYVHCRNVNGANLADLWRDGCPSSGEGLDEYCSDYSDYDRSQSTCTCVDE